MEEKKIVSLQGEKWVVMRGRRSAYGDRYAISNHGRLLKFTDDIKKGTLLKGSQQAGYPIWRYQCKGEYKHALLHRLVAAHFLDKPTSTQKVIIHLNHKKIDNYYKNLKWATRVEAAVHQQNNPALIKARKEARKNGIPLANAKLSLAEVKKIKTLLAAGKTLKEIGARFDVSDMQIYRIKSGQNWAHVK